MLREEHTVNVLENRAMRTILPLKMNGTIGS
jgi:hypothetical protein